MACRAISRHQPPKRWKSISPRSIASRAANWKAVFIAGPGRTRCAILFRVAAGLDSMLLGEAEILGQLRTAYNQALDHGATGPVLNRIFQGALEVGKRVRSETEVGARPMSVALAGVKLAERVFGNLKGHSALILGAGAVAEQVVEHMRNRGIGNLRVINRSFDRAAELAQRVGGEAVAWESLEAVLGAPDIFVTSVSATGPVLTREMLERAIAARSGSPFLWSISAFRAMWPEPPRDFTICIFTISTTWAKSSSRTKKRAKPKFRAPKPSSPSTSRNSKRGAERWKPARSSTTCATSSTSIANCIIREKLKEMDDVSPEERDRIAHITEELIERLLEEPQEKLRHGRGMRGRLAASKPFATSSAWTKARSEAAADRNARQRARALAGQSLPRSAGKLMRHRR